MQKQRLTPAQRAEMQRQQAAYQARLATPKSEPREEPIRLGQEVRSQARVLEFKGLGQGLKRMTRRLAKKQVKTPDRRVAAGRIRLRPIRLDVGDDE